MPALEITTSDETDLIDNNYSENGIPFSLPLEVLSLAFSNLDNVLDLSRAAQVCQQWRKLVNECCDSAWQKAFSKDYGHKNNTAQYSEIVRWRDKYIACTLDQIRYKYKDLCRVYDELLETEAILQRSLHKSIQQIESMDQKAAEIRQKQAIDDDTSTDTKKNPLHDSTLASPNRHSNKEYKKLSDAVMLERHTMKSLLHALNIQHASIKRVSLNIQLLKSSIQYLEVAMSQTS